MAHRCVDTNHPANLAAHPLPSEVPTDGGFYARFCDHCAGVTAHLRCQGDTELRPSDVCLCCGQVWPVAAVSQ
jgi:hypothetical protein